MTECRSFVVAAVLGTVISGCGDASGAAAPPPPPPVVKVETVVQGDVPISAEWVGSLEGTSMRRSARARSLLALTVDRGGPR